MSTTAQADRAGGQIGWQVWRMGTHSMSDYVRGAPPTLPRPPASNCIYIGPQHSGPFPESRPENKVVCSTKHFP